MNKKTIQLWIILLVAVLFVQLDKVNARKNREEIIVINNTGGSSCGGGAKTIVQTDGGKKKKKGGHKIILMAGGNGKCGERHHHHTKVVHVPVPVPVPVPVKEEKHDHWSGGGGGHQQDDHFASASSNDEIRPKSLKVSSSSIPNRAFNSGHMMSRMEKQPIEKSTLLQTLLNTNDKANRSDKKSSSKKDEASSKKSNDKEALSPQLINHHQLIDPNIPNQEILPHPSQFGLLTPEAMQSAAMMNPSFLNPPLPINQQPSLEQQQQLHNAIQQYQMQQQFEHMSQQINQQQQQQQQQFNQQLQNEHQKMQDAIASTMPQQLPSDSSLASQLPIPLPGQIISAPVFEPINPISSNKQTNQQQQQQTNSQNSMQQTQQPINQPQFNELEIIPYEVQQQLAALAQAAHLRQYQPENLKEPLSSENSLMNYNKEYPHIKEKNKKHFDHFNKDHQLEASSSNLMEAIVLPSSNFPNQTPQEHQQQDMIFNPSLQQFMMLNDNPQQPIQDSNQTIQIPILIADEQPQIIKRYKI